MDLHGLSLLGNEEHGTARGFGSFVVATNSPGTRAADPDSLEHSAAAAVAGLSVKNPLNLTGLNLEESMWAQRTPCLPACRNKLGPKEHSPCYFCLSTWSHWCQSRDGKDARAGAGVG